MQCFRNAQKVSDISLFDRAFHYGDGCFTTARIRHGKIELIHLHIARLTLACERLFLQINLVFIEETLKQLNAHHLAEGTLKILISRGEGQRGYSLPKQNADLWVFYYPQQVKTFQPDFIECGVLEQRIGISMPNLVGLKSLNRLEQVLLKQEADQKGWVEALSCDVHDSIVEGISSNCFFQINDTWITPELRYNGVHGVMRAEILARMQRYQINCEQRLVNVDEIPEIQSLFFCNALNSMRVVTQLDQRSLDSHACLRLFNHLQLNQIF